MVLVVVTEMPVVVGKLLFVEVATVDVVEGIVVETVLVVDVPVVLLPEAEVDVVVGIEATVVGIAVLVTTLVDATEVVVAAPVVTAIVVAAGEVAVLAVEAALAVVVTVAMVVVGLLTGELVGAVVCRFLLIIRIIIIFFLCNSLPRLEVPPRLPLAWPLVICNVDTGVFVRYQLCNRRCVASTYLAFPWARRETSTD